MSSTLTATLPELPEAIFDAEVVEFRLADAGAVLLALPGRGCFPAGYKSNWPQVVVDMADAAPFREEDLPIPRPTARRIDQMDEAFGWLKLMPDDKAEHRKIILLRSLTSPRHGRNLYSWRKIGEKLSLEHRTVQRRYEEGIGWICAELYKQQLAGRPWAVNWARMRQVAGSLNTKPLVPAVPPVPAELMEREYQGRHLPVPAEVSEERAALFSRYVQNMSGRSRAALTHFPRDGSPRALQGARGFGEREVLLLEMAQMVQPGPAKGLYALTPYGIRAIAMLPAMAAA